MIERTTTGPVLILRDGEVEGRRVDVQIEAGRITAVGAGLARSRHVEVMDLGGGAVLPGLHDHHIHLLALAAALGSVRVGPPEVDDEVGLVAALRQADARLPAGDWLRAVGYHESVAGPLDRWRLDDLVPGRPMRVQHRSGALWVLNSAGVRAVGLDEAHAVAGIERTDDGDPTGRLWRLDAWLRTRLPAAPPDLATVGAQLLRAGVTGVTDATPTEDPAEIQLLADAVARGDLPQLIVVTGGPALDTTTGTHWPQREAAGGGHADSPRAGGSQARQSATTDDPDEEMAERHSHRPHLASTDGDPTERLPDGHPPGRRPAAIEADSIERPTDDDPVGRDPASTHDDADDRTGTDGETGFGRIADGALGLGPVKLLLPDHELPSLDGVVADVRRARARGRTVAVHCVTREALALTLAALQEVGVVPGDRIEHGAVVGLDAAARLAELGLTVVTNPGFVAERGDRYLAEVDAVDLPDLWRCRSLLDQGVAVGAGTDAPFGRADPWAAVAAAATRRTAAGDRLGTGEAVPAARALQMFLTPPERPGGPPRRVVPGAPADLCILRTPLTEALTHPGSVEVAATVIDGCLHTW